jgi:hypothetical protein
MTPTPLFSGEVQFRRYSDTSTQGQQIVLTLADREALSVFIGKEGKRFACVLVEIGDDEMPVEPVKPARKDTRGPLCKEACDLCAMRDFWEYVCSQGVECRGEHDAKEYVLGFCGVETRKELDSKEEAAEHFRRGIRVPFIRWQRERRTA